MAEDVSETKIQFWLRTDKLPNVPPRWNGCPNQDYAVIRRNPDDKEASLDALRWGLVPSWAKDDKIAYKTINARAETVQTTPAFRGAWKAGRRCIIPVEGFYEWKKLDEKGKEKQPYLITRADKKLMALAGLWESRKGEGSEVQRTFTIITTEANEFMSAIHNRMPVILGAEQYDKWLSEETPLEESANLLKPCPNDWLAKFPVDKRMGNVKNQGAEFCQVMNSL